MDPHHFGPLGYGTESQKIPQIIAKSQKKKNKPNQNEYHKTLIYPPDSGVLEESAGGEAQYHFIHAVQTTCPNKTPATVSVLYPPLIALVLEPLKE